MRPESPKYLEDIRQAGQTVLEATAGRTLDDYLRDKLLRLAVERCFGIMGEALQRLDQHDHETASRIKDFKRIIGFRNILIHGYSVVKHDLVWAIIQTRLSTLLGEVEALLGAPAAGPDR